MGKSLRKSVTAVCCALLAFFAVGCSEKESTPSSGPDDDNVEYALIIMQSAGGSASTDKQKAKQGEIVTVTFTPNTDYEIDSVDVNGGKYAVTNGVMRFVMPSCDTEVTPEFKKAATGETFCDFKSVQCGTHWELDKDYSPSSSHYAERAVKLVGTDYGGNLLFFGDTVNKDAFVRATFRVDEIYLSERYGKFGFMLFDGTDTFSPDGVFFYVDAYVGDNADGIIRGADLGYNDAGWTANRYVPIETDGAFDLESKTVTLAMSYRDGLISMFYGDANGNDVFVKRVTHKAAGDFAIAVVSFNYGITVTDYKAVVDTDDDGFAAHVATDDRREVDVLFAGDSFMEYWKNYGVYNTLVSDMRRIGVKFANIGIGGSQAVYWAESTTIDRIKNTYIPHKIVFHVGVNDVDIGGSTSKEDAFTRIRSMFAKYHEAFPNAEMYWVSLIPNNFWSAAKHEIYYGVNSLMKRFAARTEYLEYIDVTDEFTDENGKARTNLLTDGMHLSSVYGYPLWTSLIKKSLGYGGYTVPADNTIYALGNHARRAATLGWEYDVGGNIVALDYAYNSPHLGKRLSAEEDVFYKDVEDTDVLFEAEIRSNGSYAAGNSKVGVSLVGDNIALFAYFDLPSGDGSGVKNVGFATRGLLRFTAADVNGAAHFGGVAAVEGAPAGIAADWNWVGAVKYVIPQCNVKNNFVKIGIAKKDRTVYLLVDGNVISEINNIEGVTGDAKFVAAVTSIGGNIEVKSANAVSGASDVAAALGN